jgi:hypothetical protein
MCCDEQAEVDGREREGERKQKMGVYLHCTRILSESKLEDWIVLSRL